MIYMELQTKLDHLEAALRCEQLDVLRVSGCVRQVVEYVNRADGGTPEECEVVSHFVLLTLLLDEQIKSNMKLLPEALRRIIEDLGMNFHDTHSAPDVAHNFESTPQQLLARLEREFGD